jgi:hypothetical protein
VAKGYAATKGVWQWEYSSNDLNQVDDAEQIRDHLLRAIYGSFYNAKKIPANKTLALEWVGYVGAKGNQGGWSAIISIPSTMKSR